MLLTQQEISDYQKSCNHRACVVGCEGQSLCANCNADLHPFETHVCDSCAIELLEGEVTERVRSERNG
ncbi:protein NinF [Pectobacterium brasiliense]|uniref:protein NinF n=1 Tax=Pectobacterium brasiliense TaxID=180957 RepID=UPI00333EE4D5